MAPAETNVAESFATQVEIAELSAELTKLRSETRILALEREAMSIKLAVLESEFGPITGSIPDAADAIEETDSDAVEETAEVPLSPKSVRTIDVGFVPLPVDRKSAPVQLATEARADLAAADVSQDDLAAQAGSAARSAPASISQTRFAIQLTVEDSMKSARERWKDLSEKHDPLIGRLEPAVAIAEEGDKIKIRLLAGSFTDAADAIQLCTVLIERKVDCRAVRSEGQRLVMR